MKNKVAVLLDYPYVSDFLIKTLEENQIRVIQTNKSQKLIKSNKINYVSQEEIVSNVKNGEEVCLYTNSENSIDWVAQNLAFSDLPNKVDIFKNKVLFRKLMKPVYPNYFFKPICLTEIDDLDVSLFPFPFIIKPAVGFFSLGVHKVNSLQEWKQVVELIKMEIKKIGKLYPKQVLDTSKFIIEQCIDGEEYAIDCYFDNKSRPVILNILKHVFSSNEDVSDRVYLTSKSIVEGVYTKIMNFLLEVQKISQLKDFPLHIEVRIDEIGKLMPIEINPLRFGGWCTTADFTYYSYGFNSYLYYFNQQKPDWEMIFNKVGDKVFSLVVLDNSTGIDGNKIVKFNYEKVMKLFDNLLHLRKVDYKEHPVFGFIFASHKSEEELMPILKSTLNEFVVIEK